MEVSFPAHVIQDRFLDVSECDMAKLYDAVKDCFLNHIRYCDYSKGACSPYEKVIVNLCKKYQVDYTIDKDRVAFFEALLGANASDSSDTTD